MEPGPPRGAASSCSFSTLRSRSSMPLVARSRYRCACRGGCTSRWSVCSWAGLPCCRKPFSVVQECLGGVLHLTLGCFHAGGGRQRLGAIVMSQPTNREGYTPFAALRRPRGSSGAARPRPAQAAGQVDIKEPARAGGRVRPAARSRRLRGYRPGCRCCRERFHYRQSGWPCGRP